MMWPYYNDGWGWLWMGVWMIVFWGVVIFVAVWAFRSIARPRSEDDALATLRKRLAAGEITADEFERTKKILQG